MGPIVATIFDSCGFHFWALVYSKDREYDILLRGSGKSKLERELNDRCADDVGDNDVADTAEAVVAALKIDLALRKAVAPRSLRWESIIVVLADELIDWIEFKVVSDSDRCIDADAVATSSRQVPYYCQTTFFCVVGDVAVGSLVSHIR